ncbi:acetylhydrolase [Sphingobacterium olei]|uniref:Acetylhydrolase n=2 Tax=Sphingobacterium olei TaxID=2571155 RepID=A0A4U0P4P7_9SPHI|nr:acetylhydrolase [Sphingobacterium olei]
MRRSIGILVLLLNFGLMIGTSYAQEVAEQHRERIKQLSPSIEKFEVEDAKNGVATGGILFVGSSSFTRWYHLQESFPNHQVLNRGFGGSQLFDILYFFDRVVMPYKPCQIFLYEGDNDIASGMSPEEYLEDVITFVRLVEVKLPGTRISILSTKPSPARVKWQTNYLKANQLVRNYTETKPHLQYVDVAQILYDQKGVLRPELFVEDLIHLNKNGYDIWESIIAPYLDDKALKTKK